MATIYTTLSHTGEETPAIDCGGVPRLLTCIPAGNVHRFASFASAVPVMPRSEWVDIDNREIMPWILDQQSHGSCTGFGTCGSIMAARQSMGQTFQLLSGSYLYSWVNGNRDQGASIGDLLRVAVEKGTCLDSLCPWDTIYQRNISDAARKNALRFRIEAAYVANTFDEIMTAVQLRGYFPVFAVQVGNTFMNQDAEGVLGFDRGPGNHCVRANGAKKSTRTGNWLLDEPNSWGKRFASNGYGYLTEKHIEGVQQDCFVVQVGVEDPEDTTDDITG